MDLDIRKVRTVQVPVKLRCEREAYCRLVQQGYSNTEACWSSVLTGEPAARGVTAAALTVDRRQTSDFCGGAVFRHAQAPA